MNTLYCTLPSTGSTGTWSDLDQILIRTRPELDTRTRHQNSTRTRRQDVNNVDIELVNWFCTSYLMGDYDFSEMKKRKGNLRINHGLIILISYFLELQSFRTG